MTSLHDDRADPADGPADAADPPTVADLTTAEPAGAETRPSGGSRPEIDLRSGDDDAADLDPPRALAADPAADVPAADIPAADPVSTAPPAADIPAADVSDADPGSTTPPAADIPATDIPAADPGSTTPPATDIPATDVPAADLGSVDAPPADVPLVTGTGAPSPPVPPAYTPPPSPAYAPPEAPSLPNGYTRRVTRPEPESPPVPPPVAAPAPGDVATQRNRRAWQLLAAGVALVAVAGIVLAATMLTGGEDSYSFGEVGAVTGEPVVRPAGLESDVEPLDEGADVRVGWVVDVPADGTVTIELVDGGVARLDAGARVAFADRAVDPESGDRTGAVEPAIQVAAGRVWFNPGTPRGADRLAVEVPDGSIASAGNPVAIDCSDVCTVEAPGGGVTVTSGGVELTPASGEVVALVAADDFDLALADAPSDWAQQNLDADARVGLPPPREGDTPGIVDTAVLDGEYPMVLTVDGPPAGDAIPEALRYPEGETYTIDLVADGSACTGETCTVPVTADGGASGTAQVSGGRIVLAFGQPIDCYDHTYTEVVTPGIGTTNVDVTLEIDDVVYDAGRWRVRSFSGTGSVSATLSTACNPGDVLGMSSSPITAVG